MQKNKFDLRKTEFFKNLQKKIPFNSKNSRFQKDNKESFREWIGPGSYMVSNNTIDSNVSNIQKSKKSRKKHKPKFKIPKKIINNFQTGAKVFTIGRMNSRIKLENVSKSTPKSKNFRSKSSSKNRNKNVFIPPSAVGSTQTTKLSPFTRMVVQNNLKIS